MASNTLSEALTASLSFLLHERFPASPQHARRHLTSALRSETYHQLQLFRNLLCQRPATPSLPAEIIFSVDKILLHQLNNKILTSASSIPPRYAIGRNEHREALRLSLWRGDITTLTNVTAIVNAANSQMLGCFQPSHKCIDNIIHGAAGPQLREELASIMTAQGHPEPVGLAKVTKGFNLPAPYVVHTVGPSMKPTDKAPTEKQEKQLASCYQACLNAVEKLPAHEDGRLSIAFCCISTGLFAFPKDVAASLAIRTVIEWCKTHPNTPITDIIFNVFTEEDYALYTSKFDYLNENADQVLDAPKTSIPKPIDVDMVAPNSLVHAKQWIKEADYLIISAGAGLSAADGLDYTCTSLFAQHYPALLELGLSCLYDTIGFTEWPSREVKWGYFMSHANLILHWPKSSLYASLLALASNFGHERLFVRTTNADGLFVANNFPETRVATPQGQYKYLQCFAKCRPDAVFPFAPYLEKALPFIDPRTQALTDKALIPHCEFCGTELTLCVRGGSYFNDAPFEAQEDAWYEFLEEIEGSSNGKKAVILEIGVGMNTAGVLRWPNEELVKESGRRFRLVRVGLGPSASVPFELMEEGLAVVVEGDIGSAVKLLTS